MNQWDDYQYAIHLLYEKKLEDLNLILGPLRESMLGDVAIYVNLESVLWITLLLAYFPAVHKQRIPWMPIGLAGSIWILTPGSSILAWGITLLALPYMFIIARATRSWVANGTFVAAAASFFIQDSLNVWNDVDYVCIHFSSWFQHRLCLQYWLNSVVKL